MIYFVTVSVDPWFMYPLYHTVYETPWLVEKIMDPEFKVGNVEETCTKFLSRWSVLWLNCSSEWPWNSQKLIFYLMSWASCENWSKKQDFCSLVTFMDDVQDAYLPALSERFAEVQQLGNVSEYLAPGLKQLDFLFEITRNVSVQINQRNLTELGELPLLRRIDENRRLIE